MHGTSTEHLKLARACLMGALVVSAILAGVSFARADETGRLSIYETQAQVVVPLRPAAKARHCRHSCPEPGRVEHARPMDIRPTMQIVAEAARYIGSRNPTGFRGPWCKAFVNMVARRSGYYVNASLRAVDAALMGQRIAGPVPGAYRVTRGHVSLVAAVHGGSVVAISGNNGHGRVGWSHFATRGAAYYLPIRG